MCSMAPPHRCEEKSQTGLDQTTPAPVLSETSLGVVSHTATSGVPPGMWLELAWRNLR